MVEVKSKNELKKRIRHINEILVVVAKPYVSEVNSASKDL